MFQTFTYDLPSVLPPAARNYWAFMETNSAAAVMQAVCPVEWNDIVYVLSNFRLDPSTWLKPGGNRGDVASEIDEMFRGRGWRETQLNLETKAILLDKDKNPIAELPPVYQEGYLVDNFKNRIALDVEWNAKDGNLDRDMAAYRSWFEAGVLTAAVVITKDLGALRTLARRLWYEYQMTLPEPEQVLKLPIDFTATTTTLEKAALRMRRGVMGTCPMLIVAANESTWNGQPYTP